MHNQTSKLDEIIATCSPKIFFQIQIYPKYMHPVTILNSILFFDIAYFSIQIISVIVLVNYQKDRYYKPTSITILIFAIVLQLFAFILKLLWMKWLVNKIKVWNFVKIWLVVRTFYMICLVMYMLMGLSWITIAFFNQYTQSINIIKDFRNGSMRNLILYAALDRGEGTIQQELAVNVSCMMVLGFLCFLNVWVLVLGFFMWNSVRSIYDQMDKVFYTKTVMLKNGLRKDFQFFF